MGNPIVDILNKYYFGQKDRYDAMATPQFFSDGGIARSQYYLMTCHRRENVHVEDSLKAILTLVAKAPCPVYFPASYRTQKVLKDIGLALPANAIVADPIGYEEFLCLLVNSRGVLTDSGTVVEEASVLQVPSVQMRKSTERRQVYDVGSSVKFDPAAPVDYPVDAVLSKLETLYGRSWQHSLGDGNSSQRIAADLRRRVVEKDFRRHRPELYHLPIARSYRGDGITVGQMQI